MSNGNGEERKHEAVCPDCGKVFFCEPDLIWLTQEEFKALVRAAKNNKDSSGVCFYVQAGDQSIPCADCLENEDLDYEDVE